MENINLVREGQYQEVNESEFLSEIGLIINDQVEFLNIFIKCLDENDSSLKCALSILKRDMDNVNDLVLKYSYDR